MIRHRLSIDLETFSSVPIQKSGAFKYVQSPDFEILLFAYSYDYSPVQIVDFACGEGLPDEIYRALTDPDCIKSAYNAAFEWYCLSKFCGRLLPVEQWRDTMLHGLYCGFTAGLEATGNAIGLAEDKKKLTTGKALIKYFCVPCKPTKSNGNRTRNYPKHDPDKWELFRTYCIGDVVTEMEIERRLSNFPVPDEVEKQWQTDLLINARGVAVDMDLVLGAIEIDAKSRGLLVDEGAKLSGLENPNSNAQLKTWLNERLDAAGMLLMPDMTKDTVEATLNDNEIPEEVRRMLEIKQGLSKTSTKKYDAIENAVCADGRVRGMLQFYGANRTGRWAGRFVQVQNLPRTYLKYLPAARSMVKDRNSDMLQFCYGSVPDALSQLIRTSFIPSKGNKLVDADFSSIEARVISWLAGEQWRLEVFRTHGKIYEASASQMFGVPIDRIAKGNPEYALRAKGKIAELALGYQGSVGALTQMGALNMGIPEEDLPEIVSRWRQANSMIVDLWYKVEEAAVSTIDTGIQTGVNGLIFTREYDADNKLDFLTITLPSGRKLFYANPTLGMNGWGRASINYMGVNQQTRQWTTLETYGGKLVENCVQAIARDCLAIAIENLEAAGYKIVFHIHDEVVIDSPEETADLDDVTRIMTKPIAWAPDLPLNADGWVGDFFTKD